MKGIITILLIFSIHAYTHGAPFDESEWVSAIGKFGRERNSKERNPFVWMRNSERKRNGSNVEYLQWLVKNWKNNGEKNRKKNREKPFVSLNLSRLKNKSDSFDSSSDSEQTKLKRILSGKKKWNFVEKNSNEEQEEKEEEEEESLEKMSDELSIRKKKYSDEKDSRERNSDKNDHRENNNFSESWNTMDENDSSFSERSNKYFDSKEKKRKHDSEEYDNRKSSSSDSSSWEFDSDEEKFNDYLKDLLKENQYYKEITEMLKNYKTDIYYERLYEWNKVKYVEWRKNIKLKNKILDEKETLSMEILRRICNISTNIRRKEQENRLKDCVRFYISTKDEFNFTTDLSLVHFQDTNIKTDGEESPPNRSFNNGHIRTTEGMKNSSTNEEKSFDNGNRGEIIDGEQKEKEEQEQEIKSSSRKDEIDNDEKLTDRNVDNLTQLTWSSQIGTEERTQTTKDENLINFENDTNRSEESNVIRSTTSRKYLETESSEASENRSTIFEESSSNIRDNDRNNDLNKSTVPSNNGNENIRQSDDTEPNGSENLNINKSTMISANQRTISGSTSRIEASTIWAKDGLSTISSIKFETIENNDNFTTSNDINFTIATSNDIYNNESFNGDNNVQPTPSSDKFNELRNKETIEASSRISSSLSPVYQTENSQVATLKISIDANNEQTATSTSQTINSNDFRDKDQMMETWSQESGTSYTDNVSITANINIEINTVRTENETNTVDSNVANIQTASNSTIEKVGSTETLNPESETTLIDVSSNNEKADTDKANDILENKSTTDVNGWTSSDNSESPTARGDEETTINYQTDDSIVTRKEEEAEASNSQTKTIFRGDDNNEQNVSVIIVESNKTLIEDDNLIITDINEQTDSIVETTSDNESTTKDAQIILSFSQTPKQFDIFKTERSIDDQSKTTDFVNVITDNGNNGIDDNSTSIDESTIEREEITTLSSENFIATVMEITMTQTISSQLPEIIIGTGDDIFENRNEKNISEITNLENLQTTSFPMQTKKSNTDETKRRSSIQTETDSTAFTNKIEEIEAFSSNSKNSTVTEAELTTVKLSSKLESEFVTLGNIETTSSFLQTLSSRSEANKPIEASSTRTEMILVDNSTITSININDRTTKTSNNLKDSEKSTTSIDKTDSNKFRTLKNIEPDYSSSGYDNTTKAKVQAVKLEITVSDTNDTKTDNFIIIDNSNILDLFNISTGNVKINSNVKEPNTPITDSQIYNTVVSKAVTSSELIINSNPEPLVNEMPIKQGY